MEKSKFFSLKKDDFLKGLILAVLLAVLTSATQMLKTGGIEGINLSEILTAALIGFGGYLTKNLATNSDDKILKKEKK